LKLAASAVADGRAVAVVLLAWPPRTPRAPSLKWSAGMPTSGMAPPVSNVILSVVDIAWSRRVARLVAERAVLHQGRVVGSPQRDWFGVAADGPLPHAVTPASSPTESAHVTHPTACRLTRWQR
jgi:hypothetical protein